MRPTLLRHRKFARLARLLKSDALAVGHLELLWSVTYESGDEVLGDSDDVEHLARWQGDRGQLVAALVASGFIDEDPKGHIYRVHDLWDHAPEYVRKRRKREQERRATGAELKHFPGKPSR